MSLYYEKNYNVRRNCKSRCLAIAHSFIKNYLNFSAKRDVNTGCYSIKVRKCCYPLKRTIYKVCSIKNASNIQVLLCIFNTCNFLENE